MFNREKATSFVTEKLKNFPLVGIASRERFDQETHPILVDKHPKQLLENFQSVIVFCDAKHKNDLMNHLPSTFDEHLNTLTNPLEVVKYLADQGFKSHIVHKSDLDVSLVDMAVKAGVGELSPVNSLVVKNYGLSPVIQAIVTEAPLVANELPAEKSHCIKCNLCLRVCPIRSEANAPGDMSKCACNKCVEVCPV